MAEVGVFTLENLTTGMYIDSLVIFREYIQNSCDAIDKARTEKILAEDEDRIEITIDADARRITIEDNATGIPVLDFKSSLINIAYSDKTLETDRGFRGIGRLCGLAYCRELRFTSTAKGEGIQSTVIFNAAKLREIFYGKKKYTVKEALDDIVSFDTTAADADEHFFRVELIDIVKENNDLLDVEKVRDYLSFVAPVTYSPNFYYQTEIYKHAAELNFKITEYKILVNGEPLDKPYKINVQTRMGKDEIFGVDFHDFFNDEGNLIAWGWIGLSNFKGVLDQKSGTADNKMRGIRLRQKNIQIGDKDVFQSRKLFHEDRGTTYFIGEIHTVDINLRPNGRRDYLEENDTYTAFKVALTDYFKELSKIYWTASDVRSAVKAINAPDEAEDEFKKKSSPYRKSHKAVHEENLAKLKETAKAAEKKLSSIRQEVEQNPETPLSRVVKRITEKQSDNNPPPVNPPSPSDRQKNFPPSNWTRKQRDVYWAIETVILDNSKLAGKNLLDKIKEELAK